MAYKQVIHIQIHSKQEAAFSNKSTEQPAVSTKPGGGDHNKASISLISPLNAST